MGVVFLARDTTLDRPVAVKVVHPELAVHSSITQRFLAEARMIARLRHPSILAVHSAGEATGLFYYVMDYVPGESLRQRLTRESRLPTAAVTRIVADLADASTPRAKLAGAPGRKPENILPTRPCRAMLADSVSRGARDVDGINTAGWAVAADVHDPDQAAGDRWRSQRSLLSCVVAYERRRLPSVPASTRRPCLDGCWQKPARARPPKKAHRRSPLALDSRPCHGSRRTLADRGGSPVRVLGESHGSHPSPARRRGALPAGLRCTGHGGGHCVLRPPAPAGDSRHPSGAAFENVRQDPAVEWAEPA